MERVGLGHCTHGAVLGLDGAANSIHARAGRVLKADGAATEDEPSDQPRRWFFGRRPR